MCLFMFFICLKKKAKYKYKNIFSFKLNFINFYFFCFISTEEFSIFGVQNKEIKIDKKIKKNGVLWFSGYEKRK